MGGKAGVLTPIVWDVGSLLIYITSILYIFVIIEILEELRNH
jgi:hypothetical protein